MAEGQEVLVKFSTPLPKEYHVPDTSLSVPTKLSRFGLSEIVNHLVGLREPQPFDFLTPDDRFLRTSVAEYLFENGKSSEGVLELVYVLALVQPKHKQSVPQDDWVAAVAANAKTTLGVTALYSGFLQFFDTENGQKLGEAQKVHDEGVTDVLWIPNGHIVTSSKDHSVRLWEYVGNRSSNVLEQVATIEGHTGAVDKLCFNESTKLLATGSWDQSVKLWDVSDFPLSSGTGKRRKGGDGSSKRAAGVFTTAAGSLLGHTQCITGLAWTENRIVTSSWDHTVRVWDAESCACVKSYEGQKAVQSLAVPSGQSILSSYFVTGMADGTVRLWDMREGSAVQTSLRSHRGWVSAVEWKEGSSTIFASGSYDGTVKVWDMRSNIPLHTLEVEHTDKVLCILWCGESIMSGGADEHIRIHALSMSGT